MSVTSSNSSSGSQRTGKSYASGILGVRKASNRVVMGGYQPGCIETVKALSEWLRYRDLDWVVCGNDFATYIEFGEVHLNNHLTRIFNNTSKYIQWLTPHLTSVDYDERREFFDRMYQELDAQYKYLAAILLSDYYKGLNEIRQSTGAIGFSRAVHIWLILMKIRRLGVLIRQLMYVYGLCHQKAINQRLFPKTLPMGCAMIEWNTVNPTLKHMMDPDYSAYAAGDVPEIVRAGLCLFPQLRFGTYTQWQIHAQLTLLCNMWGNVDPGCPQLPLFLELLEVRLCELCSMGWRAVRVLPSAMGPSTPLDMLDNYTCVCPPPNDRYNNQETKKVSQQVNDALNGPKPARANTGVRKPPPDYMTSSRYCGEVCSMLCNLRFFISHVPPDNTELDRQWLVWRACELFGVPPITLDQLVAQMRDRLHKARDIIVDNDTIERMCVKLRRVCLPLALLEMYAYLPTNAFSMTANEEDLENACIPRPVLVARSTLWLKQPLSALEQSMALPRVARNTLVLMYMRTLSFSHDPNTNWLEENVIMRHQIIDQLDERKHLNPTPLIMLIGGKCYVRRQGDEWLHARDVYEACALWVLCMVLDFDCSYHYLGVLYERPHWKIVLGELLQRVHDQSAADEQQRVREQQTEEERAHQDEQDMWDVDEEEALLQCLFG